MNILLHKKIALHTLPFGIHKVRGDEVREVEGWRDEAVTLAQQTGDGERHL